MNIDHFKPATVYTIYIAATPEQVWQALEKDAVASVSRTRCSVLHAAPQSRDP